MADALTMKCRACGKVKRLDEFGWSKRRARPTKSCKACWSDAARIDESFRGKESTAELLLYYAEIRSLMEQIAHTQAEAAKDGESIDRPVSSLADVWLSEMSEEAYRAILQALIAKAKGGDVYASKLLLEERHRRLGEPSKDSVEAAYEELFAVAPLSTGLDSE